MYHKLILKFILQIYKKKLRLKNIPSAFFKLADGIKYFIKPINLIRISS